MNEATRQKVEKINQVMTQLERGEHFHLLGEEDVSSCRMIVGVLLGKGWDQADVVQYMRLTEDLNPKIEEGEACIRMAQIQRKYLLSV